MQEMGGNHVWCEGRVLLLENDCDDVVADVSFPLQLLTIILGVGKERGHMKHNFLSPKLFVNGVSTSLSKLCVQTTSIPNIRRRR